MPLENELCVTVLQSSSVDAVPIIKHWLTAPPGEHAATRHTSHRCTINRWRPFGSVLTPEMLTVELWRIVFSSTDGFCPSVESGESRLASDRWVLLLLLLPQHGCVWYVVDVNCAAMFCNRTGLFKFSNILCCVDSQFDYLCPSNYFVTFWFSWS